jgi:dienelactone hydrolase
MQGNSHTIRISIEYGQENQVSIIAWILDSFLGKTSLQRRFDMSRLPVTLVLIVLSTACNPTPGTSTGPTTSMPSASAIPTVTGTHVPAITSSQPTQNIYEDNLHLFDYEMDLPVSITENDVQQEESYALHDIAYPSPKGGDVTAYLLIPEGAGPQAGILLMHGSSGSRETLLPLAQDLVLTGAVVMTIDGPAARTPNRDWIHFTDQDREEQIQLIVDLRRAVDLLAQHPSVDPARLGYVGYSYGAAMGGLLAGVEHRIRAYGLMVGDGGLVTHFMEGDEPVGGFETIPAGMREDWLEAMGPIEPIYYVSHAAPSVLFFQNARDDSLVTEADALAYQAAGSEPKRVEWYESGHGLPAQAYFDMVNWLAERIGIDERRFKGPSQ